MSLLWTVRLCNLPSDPKKIFKGGIAVFGVFLDILNTLTLIIMILAELRQYLRAQKSNKYYVDWRRRELDRDLEFAHPQWPEERDYIERERRELDESDSSYIRDKWNHFDWLTYFMMTSTIVAMGCTMHYKTTNSLNIVRGVGSVTLIFLWLRLLNYARPFETLGLFVVMLGHVVEDTLKLLFLSVHFCIPYMAAFWINFGMDDVDGYTLKYLEILYNLFQMIVVGDYNFEVIVVHSQIMARLLCGSFIFFVGIICLNLFIALMSDTFQRVYDNAKATAVMQRAKFIHEVEITIASTRLKRHRDWITEHCAPLILYYDDDTVDSETTTIKKMTHQIKDDIDEVKTIFNEKYVTSVSETTSLKDELRELKESMKTFQSEHFKSLVQTRAEITGLSLMLKELIEKESECKVCIKGEEQQPPSRRRKREKRDRPLKSILKPDSSKIKKMGSTEGSIEDDEVFVVSTSSETYVSQKPLLVTEADVNEGQGCHTSSSNVHGGPNAHGGPNVQIIISSQNDQNDDENV